MFTPKAKAFTFAASLLLVSTAMVGTSIATTGSVLAPFASGEDYAEERPLTRGHHHALGVVVRQVVDGELQPVVGAMVNITQPGGSDKPFATETTDAKGVAVFELRPGAYDVNVTHGDLNATRKVAFQASARVSIVFDEYGESAWNAKEHRAIERRGETVPLAVRVVENQSGEAMPVEGASIRVFSLKEDGSRELVDEGQTGPRGYLNLQLHKGRYVLNMTSGDVSGEQEGELDRPTAVGIMIDGDEVKWRVGKMQPGSADPDKTRPGGRPTQKPRDK